MLSANSDRSSGLIARRRRCGPKSLNFANSLIPEPSSVEFKWVINAGEALAAGLVGSHAGCKRWRRHSCWKWQTRKSAPRKSRHFLADDLVWHVRRPASCPRFAPDPVGLADAFAEDFVLFAVRHVATFEN